MDSLLTIVLCVVSVLTAGEVRVHNTQVPRIDAVQVCACPCCNVVAHSMMGETLHSNGRVIAIGDRRFPGYWPHGTGAVIFLLD